MKVEKENLYIADPPWVNVVAAAREDEQWDPSYLYSKQEKNVVVRTLRGRKMRTRQALMDEFGAALQFFDGFGENWHALKECLCYLDEWLPGDVYILIITDAEQVLVEEQHEFTWLLKTLNEVGFWWSNPIVSNGRFNRASIPFHTVFVCDPHQLDATKARLASVEG